MTLLFQMILFREVHHGNCVSIPNCEGIQLVLSCASGLFYALRGGVALPRSMPGMIECEYNKRDTEHFESQCDGQGFKIETR